MKCNLNKDLNHKYGIFKNLIKEMIYSIISKNRTSAI